MSYLVINIVYVYVLSAEDGDDAGSPGWSCDETRTRGVVWWEMGIGGDDDVVYFWGLADRPPDFSAFFVHNTKTTPTSKQRPSQ